MVPWHEAAAMALALTACGVPVKQLMYNRPAHNRWVDAVTLGPAGRQAGVGAPCRLPVCVGSMGPAGCQAGVALIGMALAWMPTRPWVNATPRFASKCTSKVHTKCACVAGCCIRSAPVRITDGCVLPAWLQLHHGLAGGGALLQ
jgi:hypothetical protein